MQARVVETDGYLFYATIEIGGQKLRVTDEFSPNVEPLRKSEELRDIELGVVTIADKNGQTIYRPNPEHKMGLDHISGWSYRAHGRIISINPVLVDCGIATLKGTLSASEAIVPGMCVSFDITRLFAYDGKNPPNMDALAPIRM